MCWPQLAFHPDPCSLPYMQKGTCDVTCNRCKPCPDPGGPNYCQANVQVQSLSEDHADFKTHLLNEHDSCVQHDWGIFSQLALAARLGRAGVQADTQ